MKKRKQKKLLSLIVLSATTFLLLGCSSSARTPIVTINDTKLYMKDFLYDIYVIETEGNRLDEYYQDNLGSGYWDYEYNGTTMRENAKNSIITQVVMNELLSDQAIQHGFTLSEKERAKNEAAIDALIETSSEEALKDVGLSREVLNAAFNKISLSNLYYNELSKDFMLDEKAIRKSITKEDYREYKTECLYVPTVTTENNTLIPMDEKDIKAAYNTISNALDQVITGTEFDTLLNENDTLAYYSRDFIYGNSNYEKGYQDAAIVLKNREYSDIISTNYGYYIIHMLDNYSMDRYDQAVEDAINAEEDAQFAVIYNKIKAQYDISINFDYWDTVTIGSITTPKGKKNSK
ncbi:MAG: putative rane protein [Herbinix sp.]|nr:putative rane protein [Herbinix sp.]